MALHIRILPLNHKEVTVLRAAPHKPRGLLYVVTLSHRVLTIAVPTAAQRRAARRFDPLVRLWALCQRGRAEPASPPQSSSSSSRPPHGDAQHGRPRAEGGEPLAVREQRAATGESARSAAAEDSIRVREALRRLIEAPEVTFALILSFAPSW